MADLADPCNHYYYMLTEMADLLEEIFTSSKLGTQCQDPGIGIFQSRNPGIGKEVRDCNPYSQYQNPAQMSRVVSLFLRSAIHVRQISRFLADQPFL